MIADGLDAKSGQGEHRHSLGANNTSGSKRNSRELPVTRERYLQEQARSGCGPILIRCHRVSGDDVEDDTASNRNHRLVGADARLPAAVIGKALIVEPLLQIEVSNSMLKTSFQSTIN